LLKDHICFIIGSNISKVSSYLETLSDEKQNDMKKIEAIVRASKFDEVKDALAEKK